MVKDRRDLGLNFTMNALFGSLESGTLVVGNMIYNEMLSLMIFYNIKGELLSVNANELFRK